MLLFKIILTMSKTAQITSMIFHISLPKAILKKGLIKRAKRNK